MAGGIPEFPRRLYTINNEPIPLKSIGYYSNNTLLFDALFAVLNGDEWEELSESRLGVLLKFNRLGFGWASRLVHYILCLQLDVKKKFEIWSLVGVTPIRFSLYEFEEYTGLNCAYVEDLENPQGDVEVTEEMSGFWSKLGLGVEAAPSIEDLTLACASAAQWSREDRIRLGYLAMYAGFIEARKPCSPVRLNLARMVMDLEAFEDYPWGRLAFQNLIESVKSRDLCKAYTIEGFVEVLQIWIYKALPDFANVFGKPFAGNPTPALLAFKGSRGRKYIRSKMLKQSRFRVMVMKDRQSAYPQWDDDNEDPNVENILRAVYQELGHGAWKWLKKHWMDEGVLINTQSSKIKMEHNVDSNESVISDDGARKRARTTASNPNVSDDLLVAVKKHFDDIKNHFDCVLRSVETEIFLGFDKVENEVRNLGDRVDCVEKRLVEVTGKRAGKAKIGEDEEVKEKPTDAEATHRVSANPSPSIPRNESEIKIHKKSPKKSIKKASKIILTIPRNTRARARQNNME